MGNKRVGAKGENKGNIKKELCKDLGSGPVRVARWLLDLQSRLIITFYESKTIGAQDQSASLERKPKHPLYEGI